MHTNNSQADQLNVTNKLSGSNNTVLVDFLNKPASEMNLTLITAPKGVTRKRSQPERSRLVSVMSRR